MKSLVTGGTGFIGGHLVKRLLEMGQEVRCLVRDPSRAAVLEHLGAEIITGSTNNGLNWEPVLDGVNEVYHLAGVTRAKSNLEYYIGNQAGTRQLVEACRKYGSGLRRFLHVSSLAAVGPSEGKRPLSEDEPFHPVSHYGRSKMMGELEVLKIKDEIPITILRPSIVFGPRERDMFEYFRMIKGGVYPLVGFGTQWVNLLHSDDLIDGIIRASKSERAVGETYFVGSERQYTSQEIGETIAKVVGRQPIRIHIPTEFVIVCGAVSGAMGRIIGRAMFFNLQKAREVTQSAWTCSVAKATEHFGFHQTLPLEESFRKTYSWYVEHGWMA